MRESEFCIPTSNKAVISITPSWYDRRALDTHADYALFTSLSHLAHLAQSSPKVRESLANDGGLERIVRILKSGKIKKNSERYQALKWQQALLCVLNVGVRGSETIRNRVVEADIVPVLVTILCNALENIVLAHRHSGVILRRPRFSPALASSEAMSDLGQPTHLPSSSVEFVPSTSIPTVVPTMSRSQYIVRPTSSTVPPRHGHDVDHLQRSTAGLRLDNPNLDSSPSETEEEQTSIHIENSVISHTLNEHVVAVSNSPSNPSFNISEQPHSPPLALSSSRLTPRARAQTVMSPYAASRTIEPEDESLAMQRPPANWDQDVMWTLRLLAYLSKYPYLRPEFSRTHDDPALRQNLKCYDAEQLADLPSIPFEPMDEDLSDTLRLPFNVFQLVEKFTMRIHADESTYWAGVIMRNSCRRHDIKGGVRQCAYLECGKWEEKNKQFAKCRRCRRTKYCSKACQSKAWKGHRFWCQQLGERGEKKEGQEI